MAAVMYDSAWPTSAEALRLCRLLDNDYADALPPRLWAWGIETNNEKGVFEADPKQLARIVRFDGDFSKLLDAFVTCDIIEPTGKPHEYRIKGWDRNAKLFRERRRLRNLRKAQKRTRTVRVRERVQNALPVAHVSSSSSSSSLEIQNTGDPPVVGSLREVADEPKPKQVRSTRGFAESAFEAEYIERGKGAGVVIAAFDELEKAIGGKLVLRCGKEGITQAQLLGEWWHPAYRHFHGIAVKQLDKHFALVRAAIADPTLRPKGPDKSAAPPPRARPPTAEESARREREREAQLAAETFVDDAEASRRFAEMRSRL
jgi:hypothetical protein